MEAVELPTLGIFRRRVDVVLRDTDRWLVCGGGWAVGQKDHEGLLQVFILFVCVCFLFSQ